MKPDKPLSAKAYGSIGHLPQSRVGHGDWHVHEGQARICLEKPRKGDTIIGTEKLDGACMSFQRVITGPTTYNVNNAIGSDSTGDGSVNFPWRSIAFALSVISTYNLNGNTITIWDRGDRIGSIERHGIHAQSKSDRWSRRWPLRRL